MRTSTTYLKPPPGYRFRPPWYLRPLFYIPVAIIAALAVAFATYTSILVADLKAQAQTFDLNKLEQMESASVILDRKGKIFGQIYVENRETVPYDQLPRDLINAVVAVEDAKFYRHQGYDLMGIVRAALKNFTAGHVRQGASTDYTATGAQQFFAQAKNISPQAARSFSGAPNRGAVRQTKNHGALP